MSVLVWSMCSLCQFITIILKVRRFRAQHLDYVAYLYTDDWNLTCTNKPTTTKWANWILPTDNKRHRFPGTQESCRAWTLPHNPQSLMFGAKFQWSTLFFHKQYREYNSEKKRQAELCKQTEIVNVPIRLNRKPSQLAVYSETGFQRSGVVERALPGQPSDKRSSVQRQVTAGGTWECISSSLQDKYWKIYIQRIWLMSNVCSQWYYCWSLSLTWS